MAPGFFLKLLLPLVLLLPPLLAFPPAAAAAAAAADTPLAVLSSPGEQLPTLPAFLHL